MSYNIIAFDGSSKLPSYLAKRKDTPSLINADVLGSGGPSFPVLSIKGKVFTLVKGSEKKVLTREDDEDEVLQNINLTVVRANTKSRVFYAKAYTEGDSDGAKPTCFSGDGVVPDASSAEPQSKKCATCPQNVWGVRDGKGTACSQNTRLAVIDPNKMSEPFLLRVPPASRKAFAEAVKVAAARNMDYNMLVMKVGFDKEAPSPKLTFKPVGLLSDEAYSTVQGLFEDEVVKEIVALHDAPKTESTDEDADLSELDAAIAAKKAMAKAATPAPTPAPAPKKPAAEEEDDDEPPLPAKKAKVVDVEDVEVKVEKKAKPAAKPAASDDDDLLGSLDALLSATDD
jgi:hypothetical protein